MISNNNKLLAIISSSNLFWDILFMTLTDHNSVYDYFITITTPIFGNINNLYPISFSQ